MTAASQPLLPVVHYLHIPAEGAPFLQGLKCASCGAVFVDERKHCAACGAREALKPQRLADSGTLVAFTSVERSYPGIPVPFVSAIVDLDGGGTVKSNLVGLDAAARAGLRAGLRVVLHCEQAPWGDEQGRHYLLFNFKLADQP